MPSRQDVRPCAHHLTNPSVLGAAGAETDPEKAPVPPQDDDATGIDDPFLEELSVPDESVDQTADDGPAVDVPIGLPMDPRDLDSIEEGNVGPDFAEPYSFDDDARHQPEDDEQGPSGQFDWGKLEPAASAEPDDSDDGPLENSVLPLESHNPLSSDESLDEEPLSSVPLSGLQIDEFELTWAKERWTECSLHAAFSPRQSLALVGTTLCIGGDKTHLINARNFTAIQDIPIDARTRRVLWLDTDANRLLLHTTLGQLYLWRRSDDSMGITRRIRVPNAEVVSMIWQLAPGVPTLLVRLESGKLLAWDDAAETPVPLTTHGHKQRLRALSDIGEPRIALWQDRNHPRLSVGIGANEQPLTLSPYIERVVSDAQPILAGFVDYVLLGVRDHGLFLRGIESPDLALVPGCRRLTALTVGLVHQRPTAFIGLFSELEDRTEVVLLDLATRRANRVAELGVLTDDAGPEDDPPERARIDTLLWDPNLMRLWAAGCFGLTCFSPPATTTSS